MEISDIIKYMKNQGTGVYEATKKNGEIYYRSSVTIGGKHISLGSFPTYDEANSAYLQAKDIFEKVKKYDIEHLDELCQKKKTILSFEKIVILLNLRDNGLYFHSPIYLKKDFFFYYLTPSKHLTFDKDDLFYYSQHKISQRGGHLYVAEYGMQVSIHSRYGIKNFAVLDRDYRFANGDNTDYRYSNIEIINSYHGVYREGQIGQYQYKVKIHINGDFVIGTYKDEKTAAIAYNKAADHCHQNGIDKQFPVNYIIDYSPKEYAEIYSAIKLSSKFIKAIASYNQ